MECYLHVTMSFKNLLKQSVIGWLSVDIFYQTEGVYFFLPDNSDVSV
jgi:hypothetical protein